MTDDFEPINWRKYLPPQHEPEVTRPTSPHPRFPKMPPRLRSVPDRNEIEFVSNDTDDVLFTLASHRAADYARQILNAVYETEGAHKHLQSSGSRSPTGG